MGILFRPEGGTAADFIPFCWQGNYHLFYLRVLVDGTCLVAYVNDIVALSCRMYETRTGDWGFFAAGGKAVFSNLAIRTREA